METVCKTMENIETTGNSGNYGKKHGRLLKLWKFMETMENDRN